MRNEDVLCFDRYDSAYLLRYILAWNVPKKTFSNDDETPAPSHVSAIITISESRPMTMP